jgi:hypothetical protein
VNWGRTDFSLFLVCSGQIVLNSAYRGGALPLANARRRADSARERRRISCPALDVR